MPTITHLDLMHATPARAPHAKPGWVYELKYDGFRVLALKEAKQVRLLTRKGNDLSGSFPELVANLLELPGDAAIDGELVVQDKNGAEMFGWLVGRAATRKPGSALAAAKRRPAAIFAFDLLTRGQVDLRRRPLAERKAQLRDLIGDLARVRFAHHVPDGLDLYAFAERMELEGVVCKRADSLYVAGRTREWLKVKTPAGKAREASRMEHLRK
jgi:bifunctional non-homologous end joining protein LigD